MVKSEVKKYFENRFREEEDQLTIYFDGIKFNKLNELQASKLVEKLSKEEIKEVVWIYGGNKSPGPDGYNFSFVKSC